MKHRPFDDLAAKLAAAATPAAQKPKSRNTVYNQVQLHPETVAQAEKHAADQKTARRRKPVRRNPPAVKDSMTVRIAEEIMETAMRLADGDMSRIELQPDGSAIVWNHPRGAGASAPGAGRLAGNSGR
jgi:hypothetical protein